MHSVQHAIDAIVERTSALSCEEVPRAAARGRLLAREIVSPLDSPPFDKALMDGYALLAADTASGGATLRVLETVTAGQVPTRAVTSGNAIRIMTGAPLPDGADAVVPVEQTANEPESDSVHVSTRVSAGANLLRRGESMRCGEEIFAAGHRLRPQDLALLAELGVVRVSARACPRIGVLATGDELVPPDQTPGPGQIRNSNETLLVELVNATGCEAIPLGIARDEPRDLREKIDRGLECDLLLLSGGVSAGQLDLVPGVLREAGVVEVFHKVNLKPGKPIWFGTRTESDRPDCLVFGLPGNPVSSLVCFEIFVRTAIRGLCGEAVLEPHTVSATLDVAIENRGDRLVYHPAWIRLGEQGQPIARPVRWAGSSDLRSTTRANGMVVLEPKSDAKPGATVPAMIWAGNVVRSGG